MSIKRIIYNEPQGIFFQDVLHNQVGDKIREQFRFFSNNSVKGSEYKSWESSASAIKNLIELSGIKDSYVTFEFQVPYSQKRIDCMLYGKNSEAKGHIIHIELKQWDTVVATNVEGNFVETYTGRPDNRVAHPSQQVQGYHDYLIGFVEIFEENKVGLWGCAYCHNYERKESQGLYDNIYADIIKQHPTYSKGDVRELAQRLKHFLAKGEGFEIFNKFMQSPVKPSRKVLDSASKIVTNSSDFSLLNDQIVARNVILSKVRNAKKKKEKSVILIKGGPGTGKTVIALHILAEIASSKVKRTVFFATKSKPLLEGIKNRLDKGSESKLLFTNLNQFIPSRVNENSVNVLIIDEAHRIAATSNHQYTKAIDRTTLSQIETLIRAAEVSIFFIDDNQVIRSSEIGNSELIKNYAQKLKCSVEEVELISQFRCNGSDNYLDWIESALGHNEAKRTLKREDNFDFRIMDSPQNLYSTLTKLNSQPNTTARLVAGFCWQWSKTLDENGQLVKDVKIGNFEMPWETHGDINKPPPGYVKWYEWAYKPEGIKQVGCIYTAQGFEFDYVGVIVGSDLKYDAKNDRLYADIKETKDPTLKKGKESFDDYVKNIYRVLMTRGMKGCYVYFVDKKTEEYFKSRIEL
ncbi:MAG TPA: DUF2075 domain-containing protein [Chitinophagaceae bacterium]|nr:DUF2075 domain-containing protein [Chitinophagaceae bacterium]